MKVQACMNVGKSSGVRKNVEDLEMVCQDSLTGLLYPVIFWVFLVAMCASVLKIQFCGGSNFKL